MSALDTAPCRPLWTVGDVADFARISTRTVRRRIADGTLPAIRVGGLVRFDPDAVVAALERPAVPHAVAESELEWR